MTKQIITINLPDVVNENIMEMIAAGKAHNRSAFIREALRAYLKDEISFYNQLLKKILVKEK